MIVGIKDVAKLFGISIVACCAVFVCTLFLNYNVDLPTIEKELTDPRAIAIFNAQVSMGKVTVAVTGGCLVATSVVMLMFYVKNYIDSHSKQLGILKALGYSDFSIAKHFWVFGLSVLVGCILGFGLAFAYLPRFYSLQNAEKLFPEIAVQFHPFLAFCLVVVPTIFFTFVSVLYADLKLKRNVCDLLRDKQNFKVKITKNSATEQPFLKELSKTTLSGKKILAFFVAFSAFCFSAMVQMSLSMKKLASESFAWMILLIGLILAFMTLILSLSSVVKGNGKTIAMMKVFGYADNVCSNAILGAYRPMSYIGFVLGTGYQYALLKLVMTFVFDDVEGTPEYNFDFKALIITIVAFVITYELVMYLYSRRLKKMSVKSIMTE